MPNLALTLPAYYRRCRPWRRDRISVSVNELPHAALEAEQTRHTQRKWENFLTLRSQIGVLAR
jgi:hypothetical protein